MEVRQLKTGEWAVGKNKFPKRIGAITYAVRAREESSSVNPPLIQIRLPNDLIERGAALGVDPTVPGKKPTFTGQPSREGRA